MNRIITFLTIVFFLIACENKPDHNRLTNNPDRERVVNKHDHDRPENKVISKYDYYIKVIKIKDGDTFTGLTQDNIEIDYRIHGIDAPEKKQGFGAKSKEKLSELIFDKRVGVKVQTKRDRYGRPVVWVYTPDGKDVSAEMLKAGMAWHYKEYDNSKQYTDLENEARDKKIGLWVDSNTLEPWNFRK